MLIGILKDIANLTRQLRDLKVFGVTTVDDYLTLVRLKQPDQVLHQSTFSRAISSNDGQEFTLTDFKIQIFEYLDTGTVREVDILNG